MSLLVRPAPPCTQAFLSRPNTYTLKLPTGPDFFFSIPFNTDWLRTLRPLELSTLHDYLCAILDDVTHRMGPIGTSNIFYIQRAISARLSCTDQLTEMENAAWAAGHGFPVFDSFHTPTSFFWDWNAIHFEFGPSVVAWYARRLYDFQHKPGFERYAVRRSMHFGENKIAYDWWLGDGQILIKWYCNGETVCVKTYGAAFRDWDEWEVLRTQLESYELDMLRKGTARLRNGPSGGWELVAYSSEGQSGISSDTSSLEYAYEPCIPAASTYFHKGHGPEETTPSNSNSWDRSCYRQAPSPSPNEHTMEHIQTSSPSHPALPHPSYLLHQANALAKTVRNLESQLFHSVPQAPAQPAIFPMTKIREDSIPSLQLYQAYAEEDDDDSTEASVRAAPDSWRDV